MGVKHLLWPQEGVQKPLIPYWRGQAAGPSKYPENWNSTLKMGDSALENKHFLNLQQKLA
jgi:hypothetical protein